MSAPHRTRDDLASVAAAQAGYDAAWQIYRPRALALRMAARRAPAASVDHAKTAVTTAQEALETAQRALAAYRPEGMTRRVLRAFDDPRASGYRLAARSAARRAAHPPVTLGCRIVRGGR